MNTELKIWFIDDEAHLRQTVKECFSLTGEAGWIRENIYLRVVNSGEKGILAIEDIKNKKDDKNNIPDILFCDLRLSKEEESLINNPTKLSGIKVLEEIEKIDEYNDTLLFVFTQVDLSEKDRKNIKKKLSYSQRKTNFFEKKKFKLDTASLDKIEDVKIEKTCEYLNSLIDFLNEKIKG